MSDSLTDAPQPVPIPPPATVKTLCLYANRYGEQFQCVLDHSEGIDLSAEDLTDVLPGFYKDGLIYFMSLYDDDRPEVLDGNGEEIMCLHVSLD